MDFEDFLENAIFFIFQKYLGPITLSPTPQIELSVKNPLAIFFASLIRSLAQAAAGLVFGADVLSLKMG